MCVVALLPWVLVGEPQPCPLTDVTSALAEHVTCIRQRGIMVWSKQLGIDTLS